MDFYGRSLDKANSKYLIGLYESNRMTSARNLHPNPKLEELERGFLASSEFLYCNSLFLWRKDLDNSDLHTVDGEICDVRSSIILGTGGQ